MTAETREGRKEQIMYTLHYEYELERALVDFEHVYGLSDFKKPADVKKLKRAWAELEAAFVALDASLGLVDGVKKGVADLKAGRITRWEDFYRGTSTEEGGRNDLLQAD